MKVARLPINSEPVGTRPRITIENTEIARPRISSGESVCSRTLELPAKLSTAPRVREVATRLSAMGFVLARSGKGDHSIYRHPRTGEIVVLDGGPNHELPKPVWRKLQKRFGWRDE